MAAAQNRIDVLISSQIIRFHLNSRGVTVTHLANKSKLEKCWSFENDYYFSPIQIPPSQSIGNSFCARKAATGS